MFAVVKSGCKQYTVAENDLLKVEKLDVEVGAEVELEALMVVDNETVTVGKPTVEGAKVICEVVRQDKDKKIIVFKYKSKKNERKKQGHRQPYTLLKIKSIKLA